MSPEPGTNTVQSAESHSLSGGALATGDLDAVDGGVGVVAFHHEAHAVVEGGGPGAVQFGGPGGIVEGEGFQQGLAEGRIVFGADLAGMVTLAETLK
ncbi:MAG TPA: hypothetical protein VHD63_25670, partial [Ktedonobacteraceae bacterium]|nr:hypothetical protein [Ktedonobacteraceae bacterium]